MGSGLPNDNVRDHFDSVILRVAGRNPGVGRQAAGHGNQGAGGGIRARVRSRVSGCRLPFPVTRHPAPGFDRDPQGAPATKLLTLVSIASPRLGGSPFPLYTGAPFSRQLGAAESKRDQSREQKRWVSRSVLSDGEAWLARFSCRECVQKQTSPASTCLCVLILL